MADEIVKARKGNIADLAFATSHGLSSDEWEKIVAGLARTPTQVECVVFSRLWAEECSYKSSANLLRSISNHPEGWVRGSLAQPAIIDIGGGYAVTLVVDHNNVECAQEPYLGAHVAFGGVLEDISTAGAKPIALMNLLRCDHPELSASHETLRELMRGLSSSANILGFPVVAGDTYFHSLYNGKPIVNVAAVGLLKYGDKESLAKKMEIGSLIVCIGSSTGYEGVPYREKPSSMAAGSERTVRMRVGDPFFERYLADAIVEISHQKEFLSFTKIGRGGLSPAFLEISRRVNNGLRIDIDKIPLSQKSLTPLEILLSETPARMMAVVGKETHREIIKHFTKYNIEITTVGEVIDADNLEFYWQHHLVGEISFRFALGKQIEKNLEIQRTLPMLWRKAEDDENVNGASIDCRAVSAPTAASPKTEIDQGSDQSSLENKKKRPKAFPVPHEIGDIWVDLLANPNICSRNQIIREFDQGIGTVTLAKGYSNATVVHLRSDVMASPNAAQGLALSIDSNSLYLGVDHYLGMVHTVALSMRNIVAVGARPIALAHCLNFGSPDREEDMFQLADAVRGLQDACRIWNIAILSDRLSLMKRSDQLSGAYTATVAMVGLVADVKRTCSMSFQNAGDRILLLGATKAEFECSEYSSYCHKFVSNQIPNIDFDLEKKICDLIYRLIAEDLLCSAHDVSGGGLAVALTECCVSGEKPYGATLTLEKTISKEQARPDAYLFSETPSRFLLSCRPENEEAVHRLAGKQHVPITGVGAVEGKDITFNGAIQCSIPLATARRIWSSGLHHVFHVMDSA